MLKGISMAEQGQGELNSGASTSEQPVSIGAAKRLITTAELLCLFFIQLAVLFAVNLRFPYLLVSALAIMLSLLVFADAKSVGFPQPRSHFWSLSPLAFAFVVPVGPALFYPYYLWHRAHHRTRQGRRLLYLCVIIIGALHLAVMVYYVVTSY